MVYDTLSGPLYYIKMQVSSFVTVDLHSHTLLLIDNGVYKTFVWDHIIVHLVTVLSRDNLLLIFTKHLLIAKDFTDMKV